MALTALWMPIVVSAVICFILSCLIWMFLNIHKNDYTKLPDEDKVMQLIREQNLPTGMFVYPFCNHKDMKNPEFQAKAKVGPWGYIIASATPPSMGLSMGMWIVNLLLIGTAVAFLASRTFAPGAHYMDVFKFVALTAFLAHGGNVLTDSIWKGRPWKALPAALFDAVVYALFTAGTFGWLWPKLI